VKWAILDMQTTTDAALLAEYHAARDRLRAESEDALAAAGRGVGADDLVPGIDQPRNKAASDRTARTCNEDSHDVLPFVSSHPRDSKRLPA
jgi:hypothetical protein